MSNVIVPHPPSLPRTPTQPAETRLASEQQAQTQVSHNNATATTTASSPNQNPLSSQPSHAYNAADLQRQFVGMSARDVYALLCRRGNCRVISSVIEQLPEKPGVWEL